MKRKYLVTAIWDEEAQIFYSKSDIHGLHIEAETLDEFESLIVDLAPDLIIENHLSSEEVNTTPLRDLIPSIVLREPASIEGAA
ncbi:MAG: DUF1902 domain-containing protein [Gammaproteobacteria bacterium]|nr:DUF1902 domain-containing protein [Gammaproteobacteria bacterium]